MKKSELIKIIKEEISNILSENEAFLASMPDDLESMSKRELENLGRDYGIELDRRYKKSTLVEQMKNIIQ